LFIDFLSKRLSKINGCSKLYKIFIKDLIVVLLKNQEGGSRKSCLSRRIKRVGITD